MLRDSGDGVHVKVHAPGGRALILAARDGGAVLVVMLLNIAHPFQLLREKQNM